MWRSECSVTVGDTIRKGIVGRRGLLRGNRGGRALRDTVAGEPK